MNKKIKLCSLFSGCGGFDYGFYLSNFDIIFAIDSYKWACNTYKSNLRLDIIHRRIQDINYYLENKNLKITNCGFKIIVQNRCLETWFLGNRVVYPRQPNSETFREYAKFYNVSIDDPELMGLYKDFASISLFHYSYLKEMLAERGIRYTKSIPRAVTDPPYIQQLIARVEETDHLKTLKDFFDFCHSIMTD